MLRKRATPSPIVGRKELRRCSAANHLPDEACLPQPQERILGHRCRYGVSGGGVAIPTGIERELRLWGRWRRDSVRMAGRLPAAGLETDARARIGSVAQRRHRLTVTGPRWSMLSANRAKLQSCRPWILSAKPRLRRSARYCSTKSSIRVELTTAPPATKGDRGERRQIYLCVDRAGVKAAVPQQVSDLLHRHTSAQEARGGGMAEHMRASAPRIQARSGIRETHGTPDDSWPYTSATRRPLVYEERAVRMFSGVHAEDSQPVPLPHAPVAVDHFLVGPFLYGAGEFRWCQSTSASLMSATSLARRPKSSRHRAMA